MNIIFVSIFLKLYKLSETIFVGTHAVTKSAEGGNHIDITI